MGMECTESEEELQETDETVQLLEQGLSAPERVATAVQCLPPYTAKSITSNGGDDLNFQYATIRDYAHAYSSGRVTPTQVHKIRSQMDACQMQTLERI